MLWPNATIPVLEFLPSLVKASIGVIWYRILLLPHYLCLGICCHGVCGGWLFPWGLLMLFFYVVGCLAVALSFGVGVAFSVPERGGLGPLVILWI
ncbi:hypothetical protein U1Q18_015305 [Sarracenia purpurea var. burkii]